MQDIRKRAEAKPELKETWKLSVKEPHDLIKSRFQRLALKDKEEIEIFQRHARELFPTLDLSKLQKIHTNKCEPYNTWKESHCRERHYSFQIRKCQDVNCCLPPRIPHDKLTWLPDPELQHDDSSHFEACSDIRNRDTTEKDRPSIHAATTRGRKRRAGGNAVRCFFYFKC